MTEKNPYPTIPLQETPLLCQVLAQIHQDWPSMNWIHQGKSFVLWEWAMESYFGWEMGE